MADKPPVVNEWIITDKASLYRALDGMRRKRQLSKEDMYRKLKNRTAVDVLRGKQENLRSDTLILTVNGLDFELVIREISTSNKSQRRVAALREEAERRTQEKLREAMEEKVTGIDERDPQTGHLKRALTPEEEAEVDRLLNEYSSY